MVVVGVVVLAFYLSLSALSAFAVVTLWRLRPDPLTAAVVGVAVAVVLGYLSFRFGTVRLLSQLDARDMSPAESPSVHRLRDRLAERMDLDPPTLKLARFAAPNAMALDPMGRDVVVLDASLFRLLDADEFEALLAHELAHLERKDGLVQTLAGRVRLRLDEFVGLFGFGLTVFVRSQSRKREFAADARAAEVTDKPMALASALRKLERAARPQHGLSPLWVYGEVEVEDSVSDLLSTHPSTDERVERLAAMADESMTRIEVR